MFASQPTDAGSSFCRLIVGVEDLVNRRDKVRSMANKSSSAHKVEVMVIEKDLAGCCARYPHDMDLAQPKAEVAFFGLGHTVFPEGPVCSN
jgi:hypothetical protein